MLIICSEINPSEEILHFYFFSRKRLTKTPKLYFYDSEIACYLLGIETPEHLSRDKMRELLFENFIVTEVLKRRYNKGKSGNIYFYRDSHQNEVDLIIKTAEGVIAIEIKSAMTYNLQFEKTLNQIQNWISEPVTNRKIVYTGSYENSIPPIKLVHFGSVNFE